MSDSGATDITDCTVDAVTVGNCAQVAHSI